MTRARTRRLGTGISALIAASPPPATTLPLASISAGYNPRRYFDSRKHEELVASLRLRGMLQPILVRPARETGDGYLIVAGGRRYRAALEAFGPEGEVPVIIREMTDQEALEAAIDENDVRDDASETEQADAAVRVLAACQDDRGEAARRLGWSKTKLDRRLALAGLCEPVKHALDERRIKLGHAELLAAVPADKQEKALETILASGLDVGKTRDLLMRVTQDLAHACFDKSECLACPFNSAAQRALFETHIEDGHCTNAGCFELKTQAAEMIRFEQEECAEKAARAAKTTGDDTGAKQAEDEIDAIDDPDIAADGDEDGVVDDDTGDSGAPFLHLRDEQAASSANDARKPTAPIDTGARKPDTPKSPVTARSIATRTRELREATWRTALARALAANPAHAQTTILVAAMSGTLPQIKAETLRGRAGLLVGASFPDLDFSEKIAEIQALPQAQAATVLSAIGAAYAKDVTSFNHVADLARAFAVDLRDAWQVDKTFLARYSKEELRFIARECGLITHIGEKAFAKLLGQKKTDLITGMLHVLGFEWAGRLPSAMTLDGAYGSPPARPVAPTSEVPITHLAA
ncbi:MULTISPECIES: PRTRC system ParB family protein [Sphingobium]|jgi:ParB/RepB/Spo0J family partition protein|uniref:ParB/RepB/Spo0J family partition protein n=1 Tax=Sphingobium scionense TaxID=1404341 RepID=A0A7W6LW79_9SPHN|nr:MULTISPECIES: PRTRC system ParB family protein [Sphingobium]MBB4150893.1 ParB/RepB/Spo0J family partition protein [Sphingobium scionense]